MPITLKPGLLSRLLLALIFLSGLVLRLAGINDPVSYDEAYTSVAFASRSLWGIVSDYSLPNNHIFHTLCVHVATAILGNHSWSIRIPALLAGLAMILVAYGFAKSVYSRESGLAAVALVAWFPELVRFSSEARGYSLVGLFTLLIFWLGWHVSRQSDTRAWVLLTLCSALGFWTIPIMLFPAGAIYLWLFLEGLAAKPPKDRAYFSSFFLSGLGTAALTGLLYLPVLRISGWRALVANGFVQPVEAGEYFSGVLATRLLDTWTTWTKDVPLLLTLLLVLGFALGLVFYRRITVERVPLSLVTFGWIALLVVSRRPNAFDRFWSFLIALLLVWAVAGLIETAKKLRGRMVPFQPDAALVGLAVAFLVVQTALAVPSFPERWSKMGNPEAAALYFKEILAPGDVVLAGYPNNAPLWYYLDLYGVGATAWQADPNAPRIYFVLAANQKKQTLESILKSYKLDPVSFALERAEQIGRYGQLILYRLER